MIRASLCDADRLVTCIFKDPGGTRISMIMDIIRSIIILQS